MNIRNGMSCKEAGILGNIAASKTIADQLQNRIFEYLKSPTTCKYCRAPFDYAHRHNIFCSTSCAASFNNRIHPKRVITRYCLSCNKKLKVHQYKYCCIGCQHDYQWKEKKYAIALAGEFPIDKRLNETNRPVVMKYLIDEYGRKCAECGITVWQGKEVPLITDHIDGDSTNHLISNFRLLCPNCDAQSDTYKNRNISTRLWRTQYTTEKTSDLLEGSFTLNGINDDLDFEMTWSSDKRLLELGYVRIQ